MSATSPQRDARSNEWMYGACISGSLGVEEIEPLNVEAVRCVERIWRGLMQLSGSVVWLDAEVQRRTMGPTNRTRSEENSGVSYEGQHLLAGLSRPVPLSPLKMCSLPIFSTIERSTPFPDVMSLWDETSRERALRSIETFLYSH